MTHLYELFQALLSGRLLYELTIEDVNFLIAPTTILGYGIGVALVYAAWGKLPGMASRVLICLACAFGVVLVIGTGFLFGYAHGELNMDWSEADCRYWGFLWAVISAFPFIVAVALGTERRWFRTSAA